MTRFIKKNKVYCIEFIGLWGSGKSTYIQYLYKYLKKNNFKISKLSDFDCFGKVKRYFLILELIFLNPFLIFNFFFFNFKLYLKIKPLSKLEYEIFKTLIKNQIIKNIILKKFKPNYLFCEGTYHLLPIFKNLYQLDSKYLIEYLKFNNFNFKTRFIFLKIDLKKCKKRILSDNNKKNKRFNLKQMKYLDNMLKIMDTNQNYILKIIKNNIKTKIVIKSDHKININQKKIINFLLDLK